MTQHNSLPDARLAESANLAFFWVSAGTPNTIAEHMMTAKRAQPIAYQRKACDVLKTSGAATQKRMRQMDVKVDEIGDQIYRVSMFMPHVRPPSGLTFNEFVVLADEPLLFHCGHRKLFPEVSAAVARVLPLDHLRSGSLHTCLDEF
jgi:hypothetical protein